MNKKKVKTELYAMRQRLKQMLDYVEKLLNELE